MQKELNIGSNGVSLFTLPITLVTSTQAILARKRSGKSYTASVQAEELLEHKQQVIVFDPTSAWHGLRSSSDGTGAGYSIVIFGGDQADAPLDWHSGRAMAAAVVEHGFSAIFDIGNLHTEEQVQFVMDFCSELLRINRNALHVYMDEADTFAPQKPLGLLQNKCLGTVSRMVKQGGIKGIGFTMITQRPASVNKDVLSQVDILTVLRMSHPLDIKAATDWIKSEVTVDFAKTVEAALPSLPVGTAFFCSASLGIGDRVQVRKRCTFNSGATPKPGERRIEPKVLAPIDIEKLGQQIAASVQRAKEDSPEFLKKKIAELEKQVTKGGKDDMAGLAEHIAELEAQAAEIIPLREEIETIRNREQRLFDGLKTMLATYYEGTEMLYHPSSGETSATAPDPITIAPSRTPPTVQVSIAAPVTEEGINTPQQRILNAMATLYALPEADVTIEWISLTAGTTPRARGFEENMRQLKKKGLIEGIRLTDAGKKIARVDATPATFNSILDRLAVMVSGPQLDILKHLKVFRMSPEDLASSMGTTERSRGFEENIRQLKKRELITFSGGRYRIVAWLAALAS